jgi:hypothetical protein
VEASSLLTGRAIVLWQAFGAFAGFTLIFVSYIWVAAQGNVVQHTPANLGRTYRDDQRLPACEIGNKLANVPPPGCEPPSRRPHRSVPVLTADC